MVNPIPGDFDRDDDVDLEDVRKLEACATGPDVPYDPHDLPPSCSFPAIIGPTIPPDFDADFDVDHADFGILQRCYSGQDNPGDPDCAQ